MNEEIRKGEAPLGEEELETVSGGSSIMPESSGSFDVTYPVWHAAPADTRKQTQN